MKIKKILVTLIIFIASHLNAQEALVAAGGDLTGSNGSVNFTVGQVIYTTNTGTNGYVVQGVQQAYEIQTLGANDFNINLLLTVYPNPTVDLLTLDIKNYNLDGVKYQLFDINGRLVLSGKVVQDRTNIQLENFPAAVYLLKVLNDNKELKTFKIIKKD